MARVILLCGRICSGKSTYARALQKDLPRAVVLSCDALMLAMFPQGAGEHHDLLAQRAKQYLFAHSLDLLSCGTDIIMDWGFWTKAWRQEARAFYAAHGVDCALHYVDALPEVLDRHIQTRNEAVSRGVTDAYAVDEGLLQKQESLFEPPAPDEIDVWYHSP